MTFHKPRTFAEQDFHPYTSSSQGASLQVKPWEGEVQEVLWEDPRPFHPEAYAHPKPQGFTPVGLRLEEEGLPPSLPRCLDMPLRLAGDEVYYLPQEWEALGPLLEKVVACEHAHNPSWRDYHAYLTVDVSEVEAGEQQRHGGLHVDGFQGVRVEPKTKVNRSYVATTNGGTRYYPQGFALVDPRKWNVFQGFDLQAGEASLAEEGEVYFMNAYSVHESGLAGRSGLRYFVRLSFDLKEFDRWGNTHNALLDYSWEMVTRATQEEVATPSLEVVEAARREVGL